jgi:hypothetical protein
VPIVGEGRARGSAQPLETMISKKCHSGLDNRCRDNNGEIRHKNGSTLVGRLRHIYGKNFTAGIHSDMKLDTLLDRTALNF